MFPDLERKPFAIRPSDHERIRAFLRLDHPSPYASQPELSRFLASSIDFAGVLPRELLVDLLRFRHVGNEDGAFLVSDFPFDGERIGPTPEHWNDVAERRAFQTEMITVGIGAVLGDVFAFSLWQDGRLIQNVVPARDHEYKQKSSGWGSFLEWHIEDAFSDYRADFAVFFCLRGDPRAATTICPFKGIRLSEFARTILRQERFTIASGDAQESSETRHADAVAVLWGDEADPCVRFDPFFTRAIDDDKDAKAALTELHEAVAAAARQVTLKAGDILIIDNARAAHGRTSFTPRYDGMDRWLQRALVTLDLRKSWKARNPSSRVVRT